MRQAGETTTDLAAIRKRRGMSAAALAQAVGVSRQTIYAIEDGSYTPNTVVALRLAGALQVRVEDLFRLASEPAAEAALDAIFLGEAEDSRYTRLVRVADRVVAAPSAPSDGFLPVCDGLLRGPARSGEAVAVDVGSSGWQGGGRLLLAGCDPALSLLCDLVQPHGVELITVCCSSRQALRWLEQGLVHAAGSHIVDRSTGEYNLPLVRRLFPEGNVTLINFAGWQQGLVVRAGNPKSIGSMADLGGARIRTINREKGSGSRDLLDAGLRKAGIDGEAVRGYDQVARNHLEAAGAVARGKADCCVATQAAATAFGLGFIPLTEERFDLCFLSGSLQLPAVRILLDVLNGKALRQRLQSMVHYATGRTGEVLL